MDANLEQLGPVGFQDLAATLAMTVFGAGVQAMGPGRDGGRDLYHKGPLIWAGSADGPGEVWDGYTVMQIKHKKRLSDRPAENASWLWQQIRQELDEWSDPESGRDPVPTYLLVITNVPLTPVPQSGGHDQLNAAIQSYMDDLKDASRDVDGSATAVRRAKLARLGRLRRWRFWDAIQIQRLLEANPGVRRAFPGFLTPADVFASLNEFAGLLPLDELEPGLRAHARTTLIGEGLIYFDEAGGGDGPGIPVHEVAIDLPVTVGDKAAGSSVIRHVLDRGEHVLMPSLRLQPGPRHLVLTGAPGNGKTTISKFLVQAYRAAMLSGASDLSPEHEAIISGTESALARFERGLPKHRRWPMRIDLAEYAQQHGWDDNSTLLRWLAEKISKRSDLGEVRARALIAWMKTWPWFVVLDGLDEVTEPSVRKRVITRIVEFVTTADADDCDVFVVLTTRPMGYAENIAPTQFERVDLDYLQPQEAVRYGSLVTKVRLRNDLDRIDKVLAQLERALEDDGLRNLLRTPLQVLIMTIIMSASGQLAPDRFSLFWSYYETVFKRERDKPADFRRILQEHSQQILQLHELVGFELQARSEAGERSQASLSREELESLTWQVLETAGFKPSGVDADLLAKIVDAATKRLVLIAPRGDHGYGFDVRSLQELMAGMYLTTGPQPEVLRRLSTAAASPHWRNTWIFSAGRVFSAPQEHEQRGLVELVETVDDDAPFRLGAVVPIGPRLALDLVDDGMVRSLPKWRDRLIAHGLRVLQEPSPPDLVNITRMLVRFADTGEEQRRTVAEGLRDALGGRPVAQATAVAIQALVPSVAAEVGARPDTQGLVGVRKRPGVSNPAGEISRWSDFDEEVATFPASGDSRDRLHKAAVAVRAIVETSVVQDVHISDLIEALADDNASVGIAEALEHVAINEPDIICVLRDRVVPPIHRRAVGELLRHQAVVAEG